MQDGKVIFNKGYGLANTRRNAPVTTSTLFAVGSVTKQFTCAVALQLEQEGKLSFDDRVSRYRADFGHASEITLRDLGNHVSGYRDYYPLDFVDRPMAREIAEDDLLKTFTSKPLDFPPGTRYSYSNTGYLLLGQVASLVSRKPFDQLLQERILTPLGMTLTRFEPARGGPGLAEGYTQFGLGPSEVAIPEGRGWIGAAGGIWSTPEDLMKWDLALMDGKVVNAKSWKTMTTPRELKDGRSSAYGCGLQLRDRGPLLVLVHGGGVSGFGARNAMIPATRSAIVVMANADYSGGVLDSIQEAVLAKMMPAANAPKDRGAASKRGGARHVAADPIRHRRPIDARRRIQRVPHAATARGDVEVARGCRRDQPGRNRIDRRARRSRGVDAADARRHHADQHVDVSRARRQDRGVPVQPPMTDAARRILLAILLLGVFGISAELLLLKHTEDVDPMDPARAERRNRGDERRRRVQAFQRGGPIVPARDAVDDHAAAPSACICICRRTWNSSSRWTRRSPAGRC